MDNATKSQGQILQEALHTGRRALGLVIQAATELGEAGSLFAEFADEDSKDDAARYQRLAAQLSLLALEFQTEERRALEKRFARSE